MLQEISNEFKPTVPLGPLVWLACAMALALATLANLPSAAAQGAPEELDCVIEPYVEINLGSPVSGIIESIKLQRSDPVAKGQVVAKLQADVEQARVALARSRAEFTGEIEAKQAKLAFAQRKLQRTAELFVSKAVPFHLKDEAETEEIVAARELEQAKQSRRLAQLELSLALETLRLRTLRSPIAGVVVERFMEPGEFVEEQPIVKLAQIDPLRVEVILPVSAFGSIEAGMHAEVFPEIGGDRSYAATVAVVDRVSDAASGTFAVRLDLPNPDNRLLGGLRCTIRFHTH